jgi:hypothetical protein
MALSQIGRVHGQAAAGAFYGLQPLVVKVAATGKFTASTGGGTSAITEGGYDKAVRALQQVASIVWLGAQDDDNFTAVVDGASVNQGDGTGGSGATTGFAAYKAALVANCGGSTGNYTITTSSALNGAGTFTFA